MSIACSLPACSPSTTCLLILNTVAEFKRGWPTALISWRLYIYVKFSTTRSISYRTQLRCEYPFSLSRYSAINMIFGLELMDTCTSHPQPPLLILSHTRGGHFNLKAVPISTRELLPYTTRPGRQAHWYARW